MDNKDANIKGVVRHSVAYRYRSKSKDKLPNGKMTSVHSKYKITSKVPRIVRSPFNQCNTNKSTDKIAEKLDNSGDNKAGTSKTIHFLSKREAVIRQKPSHIPRRKIIIKDTPTRETPHTAIPKKKNLQYIGDRNVQRVHMLINQDYLPEQRAHVQSVARPIPTLGNIYGRVPNTESANMDDWFSDINAPVNSIASNVQNASCRQPNDTKETLLSNAKLEGSVSSAINSCISPFKHLSVSADDNSDWTTSDMEYPTRDNDPGYHTLSSLTHNTVDVLIAKQMETPALMVKESTSERIDKLIKRATASKELAEKDGTVTEQPTMVLAKVTPTLILSPHLLKTDASHTKSDCDTKVKNCQFPSDSGNPNPSQINQNQHTVPSYVECLSEILQKTTNFEGDGCAGTPNSLSSIAGTDLEIRDELSSECTLDDCSMCDHAIEWCHKCGKTSSVQSKKEASSDTTSIADSTLCRYNYDSVMDIDTSMIKDSIYNIKLCDTCHHRSCWKKRSKASCEKYEQYKRFPSCRYKELTTFSSSKGRISLRICRRRLSRVWKKTTERWALWSAKPPQRFKKNRMMRYLQRGVTGEDADVQTNTFIFRETGTDSMAKERKSQAIAAFPSFESSFTSYKSEAGTVSTVSPFAKNRGRNCNLGPSLFPFFYNPERNAIIKQTIECNPLSGLRKEKNKTNDKETQKTENIPTESIPLKEKCSQTVFPVESECPESMIQICEITVDDKDTGTEDIPSAMQEQMTSTLLHFDSIRMVTLPTQNVNTQMWIVCNDAETNVRYPCSVVVDSHKVEVSTGNSENIAFFAPCAITTEAQVTPPSTTENQPTGVGTCTSKQINPIENNHMIFIPVTPINAVGVATSKKEYFDAGLMVFNSKLNTAMLTTPSLQICQSPIATFKSCGTETDEISIETNTKSATKLKTYVNTGMLINAIVEKAVLGGKFSTGTDTKSIGNKYTSDIGVCTNTILKDSVIETEKEVYPSVSTNTFMKQESKYTEQNSSFAFEDVNQFENATQYSNEGRKVGECLMRRSEGIGDSYLMAIRTLSRSVGEIEVQTDIAFTDHGFFEVPRNKCTSSVSTSYSIDTLLNNPQSLAYRTAILKDTSKKRQTCPPIPPQKSSSNIRVETTDKRQISNATLSSALDAAKWIRAGYPLEIEQTTNDSCNATTVIQRDTKSVDITTQYIDQPADMSQTNEIKAMAQETIDYVAVQTNATSFNRPPKPTTLTPRYQTNDTKIIKGKSDSKIVCSIIKTIEQSEEATDTNSVDLSKIETKDIRVQPEENQACVAMVDGVTSDVLVKDVKEITLQACPENCDAGTECFRVREQKSASALTSRCILPGLPFNCCENHKYGDLSGDCRFVYGMPHCVVHTPKPEEIFNEPDEIPHKLEQCIGSIHAAKKSVQQAAGLVIMGAPYNRNIYEKGDTNKNYIQSQFHCSSQGVFAEGNPTKSYITKCSCTSNPSTIHKQISRTIDDLPMITVSNRACTSNKNNKFVHSLPVMTSAEFSITSNQPKQSSGQPSRKASVASTKPQMNDQHCLHSVSIMTTNKPAMEQQTSDTSQVLASNATSINRERFGRAVGLITSLCNKNPTAHKQTSNNIIDETLITTATSEDHSTKRSADYTTSSQQKPLMCQKHTSNMYTVACAKTSVQQPINHTIGLITSRQNNPPIHNKACSNIIKCATAKTSMYDEMNTQSVGVANSNVQNYYNETSTHLAEHCVQSVGVINAEWRGKAAVKRSHAFVDAQNSEFGFLLSPKEYEALYKTTRYLSKEAARATTAIKEEQCSYQPMPNQDAAVEVMLRAEMRSEQNMTTPALHSATVMTSPSVDSSRCDSSATPTACCSEKYSLEIPTRDNDNAGNCVKSHLAASCRYYSTLLTKHLDNVKENLTKHLASAPESPMDLPIYCEACTMKPSAREEFGCQTFKDRAKEKPNVLDPAENETDICRHDKEHLQSVYYMLTAIEGRLRRLKPNGEYES